jgi:hypothetical protein
MTEVTTIDITVDDEMTLPDVIVVSDLDTVFPDLVELVGDVVNVTVIPDIPTTPGVIEVSTGIPGIQGPPGPPGILRVDHGSNPTVARPDAAIVLWVGSVTPAHRDEAVDLIAWTP